MINQTLQPKITQFLDGLRQKNKLKSGARLVETIVGKPNDTLFDIPGEALTEIESVAEEIVSVLQRRADERGVSIRTQLIVDGVEPLYLPCKPTAPASPTALARRGDATYRAEIMSDNPEGFGGEEEPQGPPRLAHQAAAFAMEALSQNRAMFRLTIGSSLRREERDTRIIAQREAQITRYQQMYDQAVLIREQLLDRTAERQLEIDRVKQRDKWMQEGFAKIVSLIVLHAPMLLQKFGMQVDPRARELLFDIVGSVGAAKPYVNAMKMAASASKGLQRKTRRPMTAESRQITSRLIMRKRLSIGAVSSCT